MQTVFRKIALFGALLLAAASVSLLPSFAPPKADATREETGVTLQYKAEYTVVVQENEGGYGTIVPKSNPGRPSRLTEAQMRGFADLVDEGNLTTAEAAMLLRERYDIVFTNKHIAEILHSQGLRCVMAANESEETPEGPGSRRARGCRWTRR